MQDKRYKLFDASICTALVLFFVFASLNLSRHTPDMNTIITQPFGILYELPPLYYTALTILSISFLLSFIKKRLTISVFSAVLLLFFKNLTPYLMFKTLIYPDAYAHVNTAMALSDIGHIPAEAFNPPDFRYLEVVGYLRWPFTFIILVLVNYVLGLNWYISAITLTMLSNLLPIIAVFILSNRFFGAKVAMLAVFITIIAEPQTLHFSPFKLATALAILTTTILIMHIRAKPTILLRLVLVLLAFALVLSHGLLPVVPSLFALSIVVYGSIAERFSGWKRLRRIKEFIQLDKVARNITLSTALLLLASVIAHWVWGSYGILVHLVYNTIDFITFKFGAHRTTGFLGYLEPFEVFQLRLTELWLAAFYAFMFAASLSEIIKILRPSIHIEHWRKFQPFLVYALIIVVLYIFLRLGPGYNGRVHPIFIPILSVIAAASLNDIVLNRRKRRFRVILIFILLALSVSSVIRVYPTTLYPNIFTQGDIMTSDFIGQHAVKHEDFRVAGSLRHQALLWPYFGFSLDIHDVSRDEFALSVKSKASSFSHSDVVIVDEYLPKSMAAEGIVEANKAKEYIGLMDGFTSLQRVYDSGCCQVYFVAG